MRFKSTGRISNYEITNLRKEQVRRGVRWTYLWASLSDETRMTGNPMVSHHKATRSKTGY